MKLPSTTAMFGTTKRNKMELEYVVCESMIVGAAILVVVGSIVTLIM